ncbi:acid protease [Fomitopsis serialis]|uniref:acid protease n=1 Tax=Fomitopsis serialis TaxID=139415 RepID=UPI0020072B81|nr:acid protease [Neoantrodia serialis]KAH9926504.1 acid protease [Neoantrodia serialis]
MELEGTRHLRVNMFTSAILTLSLVAVSARAVPQPVTPDVQPISLSARKVPKGHVSSLRKRAGVSANVALDDYFNGTDLQWYGDIQVGTPPQNISVIFDTGSFTLEVTGTECGEPCANQPKFDTSQSSTYVGSDDVTTLSFSTGIGVDTLQSEDEYVLWLRAGHDTVSVGGFSTPDVALNTIINQTEAFDADPMGGIQGMGPAAIGFWKGLQDQGINALFGLYLSPKSVGNAELTIGGIDSSKYTGDLTYVPISPTSDGSWELDSPAVYVNGQTVSAINTERTFIFDSGTPNVYFDDADVVEAIYALISPDIKPYDTEPGTYGIACDKIDQLPAQIDFTFMDTSGTPFNLTIPSSEFNVGPFEAEPTLCQTMINALDGLDLIGGSLLKQYYSVWDISNQQMAFAKSTSAE